MTLQRYLDEHLTILAGDELPFRLQVLRGRIAVSIGAASFEDHSPGDFTKCAGNTLSTPARKSGNDVEVFGNCG